MAVTIHPLPSSVQAVQTPEQFTYPFCYEPHPLCIAAADEVRRYLTQHPEWHEELQRGKMFGVLVVENGFLAAFSGTLDGKTQHEYFVPPVFDLMAPGCYFQEEEAAISAINREISLLSTFKGESKGVSLRAQMEAELIAYKQLMRQHKAERDALRRQLSVDELAEEPLLKGNTAFVALLLQLLYLLLLFTKRSFFGKDALLPSLLQAAILGLLMLTLADECRLHLRQVIGGKPMTQVVAPRFALLHLLLVGGKFRLHLGAQGAPLRLPLEGGE